MSMNLNSVTKTNVYWPTLNGTEKTKAEAAGVQILAEDDETALVKGDYDVYESELTAEQTRSALAEQLKAEQVQIQERFLKTVRETLGNQGREAAEDEDVWKAVAQGDVTAEVPTGQSVSPDDYWGAAKTAQRIVDFAKALAGDDPAMAEIVRQAFIEGYQEAQEIWGGALPSVCSETYDEVMALFDEWAQSAAA